MSGAGGRYKTRRQRNTAEDPQTLILRQIDKRNQVSYDDILELYHINKLPCQGCRVNNKDSPNCFCALIPPPGGFRKSGTVWQKLSDTEAKLGPDPQELLRPSSDSPSGLTNLGATCYVNSVLQCLYRIKPFIRGFFAAEPDLLERQSVLQKLALLFGELHFGRKKAVDSAPLAKVLELNNSIQQDGQEFLKLLLSSLEGLLGLSKHPQARRVVKDVFRGTLSHVTRCSKCGQESAASKQVVDFYELELNVKGLTSLEESLDDYLSVEQLIGDNQFLCESCNTRVDATHCSKLRSLPPVLNFQLKRFVFDAKTSTKKKVTSKFSFPQTLDMSSRLSVEGLNGTHFEAPLLYDLSGILIHKGSTANSGHYVANIKDDVTGEWWEFDDELVTSLGSHPFVELSMAASKKEAAVKETHARGGKVSSSQEASCDVVPHILPESEMKPQEEAPDQHKNCLTSADAYMLIYNLRELPGATTFFMNDDFFHLPDDLHRKIDDQNKELEDRCAEYKLKINKELSDRADRKQEIKTVLSEISVERQDDKCFWISSSWLRTWADELEPPPIDNSELLCEHGKVPPAKVSVMKRISEAAWARLQSKYGGGPELSADNCCIECIIENARSVASASCFKNERMKIKQMLEDAGATAGIQAGFYYVSKTWLQTWLRRKAAEAPTDFDASPTAAITCPHKALLPENFTGAKRQAVPEEVWKYFLQVALQIQENLGAGCISFHVDTPTCPICDAEMMEVASQQQDLKATKMEERQKHEVLFSGESITVVPGATYYLVPSVWLCQWRSYLGGSGKKSYKAEEPLGLEDSLRDLLCQKHEGLLFRPPKLQRNRRGELVQSISNDDIFTVVSEEDWKDLCGRWNVNLCQSIEALVVEAAKQGAIVTSTEESALMEGFEGCQDDTTIPIFFTKPEVCNVCIEERESSEFIKKLQYVDEEIYVDMVDGKEPPKSLLEPSKGERRASKRARRSPASSNKRVVLKVSGDTTVYQLKLLIWESFSVVKENQRVHFCSRELTDDSATLSDLNILPGTQLWVMDTGLHENRDIAEEFYKQDANPVSMEEGFSGTLLARLPTLAGSFSLKEANESLSPDVLPQIHEKNGCSTEGLNGAACFNSEETNISPGLSASSILGDQDKLGECTGRGQSKDVILNVGDKQMG